MRILPTTLFLAFIILLLLSNDGFSQGPCPPSPCLACLDECTADPCSVACIDCVTSPAPDGCQGTGVPISDHAGYLLVAGIIISSVYFIRHIRVPRDGVVFRSK